MGLALKISLSLAGSVALLLAQSARAAEIEPARPDGKAIDRLGKGIPTRKGAVVATPAPPHRTSARYPRWKCRSIRRNTTRCGC